MTEVLYIVWCFFYLSQCAQDAPILKHVLANRGRLLSCFMLHLPYVCLGHTSHTDGHTYGIGCMYAWDLPTTQTCILITSVACMSGTYQPNRQAYSLHQLHAQHCAGCCEVKSYGKDSVSSLMKNYTSSLKTKNKTGIIERRLRIYNLRPEMPSRKG